jgi:hypothetical protein
MPAKLIFYCTMPKNNCRYDLIKSLNMVRLSWITWLGQLKSQRLKELKEIYEWKPEYPDDVIQLGKCYASDFEEPWKGPWVKECKWPLGTERDKKMDPPLVSPD